MKNNAIITKLCIFIENKRRFSKLKVTCDMCLIYDGVGKLMVKCEDEARQQTSHPSEETRGKSENYTVMLLPLLGVSYGSAG